MRVDTPTEAIGRRFGGGNELFFSCALIVFTILNAGIWLNALGVFSSAVFEADINLTIIFIGFAVVFISVLAGAWGVVASDFVQTLTVAVVSIACAVVALVKVGGPVNLVQDFPVDFVMGPNMNYGLLLVGTFVFFLAKQLVTIMNMHDSFRFLNAKDTVNARKAALLAMCLMAVGSIIWFIPPWASAILYPDAAAAYPELGNKASDAVYLVLDDVTFRDDTSPYSYSTHPRLVGQENAAMGAVGDSAAGIVCLLVYAEHFNARRVCRLDGH